MKRLILALLLLLLSLSPSWAVSHGAGTGKPSVCPARPTPDGTAIFPGSSCIIGPDNQALYWFWAPFPGQPSVQCIYFNTSPVVSTNNLVGCANSGIIGFEIANCGGGCASGTDFLNRPVGPFTVWTSFHATPGFQISDPMAAPMGAIFQNQTHTANYFSISAMLAAAQAGDTLFIPTMPAGIPIYFDTGKISVDNVTLNCQSGAAFGGAGTDSVGVLVISANNATVSGCEIAYSPGIRGIDVLPSKTGFTLTGSYIHDSTGDPGSGLETGGCSGTVTVTNNRFDRNGNGGGGQSHNVYFGACGTSNTILSDNTVVTFTGNTSTNVLGGGHLLKMRSPNATITGNTFGCTGNTIPTCEPSAPIDFPCAGGSINLSHNTIESPWTTDGTNYIISWGVEWIGLGAPTIDNSQYYEACPNVRGTLTVGSNVITNIGTPPFTVLKVGQLMDPANTGAVIGYAISAPGIPLGTTITAFSAPPCPCTVTLSAAVVAPLPNGTSSQVLPAGITPTAPTLTLNANYIINDGPSFKIGHSEDAQWPTITSLSPPSYTNSIIVNCSSPLPCNSGAPTLSAGDVFSAGTGNTTFASRAAAGLAAWPFLPAPP